jgi:hypothetical protein
MVLLAAVVGLAGVTVPAAGSADGGARTGGVALRHVHSSGRFDVPRGVLEKDLDRFMRDSDLVTMTEVHTRGRASALREPGWQRFWRPGHLAGECGLAWRADKWGLVSGASQRLTGRTFRTARHDRRTSVGHAATAVLRSADSGRTVLVSVAHLPSNVESSSGRGWNHRAPDRVRAYKAAILGWRRDVLSTIAQHRPDSVMVTGDWNLDLKRSWVRHWLHTTWDRVGAMKLDWKSPFPRGGTLVDHRFARTRRRLIDATFVAGASYAWDARLMGDIASSDHNPYRETISLP